MKKEEEVGEYKMKVDELEQINKIEIEQHNFIQEELNILASQKE